MKIWEKIKSNLKLRNLLGLLVGAGIGFAYYYFVGCNSGTCAISANPVNSTLYGSLLGLVWTLK